MNENVCVAVIGGGASGVFAAIRLLNSERARLGRLKVVLIEAQPELGAGIAYATDEGFHLLNVASGRMGATEEDPEDFRRWVETRFPSETRPFLPRRLYRKYLQVRIAEAADRCGPAAYQRIQARARKWTYHTRGIRIEMEGLDAIYCDRLIVATGYGPASLPSAFASITSDPRVVSDPWNSQLLGVSRERTLVLGSGLTAVDFLLRLSRNGSAGSVLLLSRNGLRPLGHLAPGRFSEENPPNLSEWNPRRARTAFADVRRWISELKDSTNWPLVVDEVRKEAQRVWLEWPSREKLRFLRHLRTIWEVHRHRIGNEVLEELEKQATRGFFSIRAGRVVSASAEPSGIRVKIRRKRGGTEILEFDSVVNCTGVNPDVSFFDGHSLLAEPLRLGIETDEWGRPYDQEGRILEGVAVLGPALRPRFWEISAIPELRVQARVVCEGILASLEGEVADSKRT